MANLSSLCVHYIVNPIVVWFDLFSVGLDPETKKRHMELTQDFLALTEELKAEGLMDPNPHLFGKRILQSLILFLCGLSMSYWLGTQSLIWRGISILFMTMAGGLFYRFISKLFCRLSHVIESIEHSIP